VLVVASIAGVWFVVAAARQTVPVLSAARTIVVGETISDDDLRVVEVALGELAGGYLAPGALAGGAVATRTVEAGELVPQTAVGDIAQTRTTSVVVRSTVDIPGSVTTGSVVEVWAAAPLGQGAFDTPRILVADATVVSVNRDESMMGGGAATLEIVIPRADVPAVLAAMAGESALSVVPASGVAS
jgi:hypothetical protein